MLKKLLNACCITVCFYLSLFTFCGLNCGRCLGLDGGGV